MSWNVFTPSYLLPVPFLWKQHTPNEVYRNVWSQQCSGYALTVRLFLNSRPCRCTSINILPQHISAYRHVHIYMYMEGNSQTVLSLCVCVWQNIHTLQQKFTRFSNHPLASLSRSHTRPRHRGSQHPTNLPPVPLHNALLVEVKTPHHTGTPTQLESHKRWAAMHNILSQVMGRTRGLIRNAIWDKPKVSVSKTETIK